MIEAIFILLIVGFLLAIVGWLIGLTSYHAYRRGYNPVVWALAAIIAMNPIFLFVVLALAPHRSRLRLRDKFHAELDAKLAGRKPTADGRPVESDLLETRTAKPHGVEPRPLDATQTFLGDDRELDRDEPQR